MTSLIVLSGALLGCFTPRPSGADQQVDKLRLGMRKEDVISAIGRPDIKHEFSLREARYLFDWTGEATPYDLFHRVSKDPRPVEIWSYYYWINSNSQLHFDLFFEGETLLGWVKPYSDLSARKYEHERITSQLRKGMKPDRIKGLLGSPSEIIKPLSNRSPLTYVDHYWTEEPFAVTPDSPMWVYTYPLENGETRRVYLFFDSYGKLLGWGYDHAHEEAQRYLREHAETK